MGIKLYFLIITMFLSCNKLNFSRVKYKDGNENILRLVSLIHSGCESEEYNSKEVETLLSEIDVNIECFLEDTEGNRDKEGYTLAMIAAVYGRSYILEKLIEAGAKLDVKTKRGSTALDLAEKAEKEECVDLITKHLEKNRK